MNWNNVLTDLLGITYPIIQAPMLHVGTAAMVAAANQSKALGSLPLGDLPAAQCVELIRATKALTSAPFATNIFVYDVPAVTNELAKLYEETRHRLITLAEANQLAVEFPRLEELQLTDYREQVDILLQEQCKIVSFTFGNLDRESIRRLKSAGCILIGTCTSVAEAIALEQADIDILCVQGLEAGGHRGSFSLTDIPAIGGFSLLPSVRSAVKKPLIYAGGVTDAQTWQAARLLGAQAVQVGSILLRSKESALLDFEKNRLAEASEHELVLTRSFSGRYARGLQNEFSKQFDALPVTLPYPYQNKLTAPLRKAAKESQNPAFISLWYGSSLAAKSTGSTTDILRQMLNEAEALASQDQQDLP